MIDAGLRDEFAWSALVPELIVTDLAASLHFWMELLGFSMVYERADEGFVYLELGAAQIMLSNAAGMDRWITAALEPPLGRGINLTIGVDGIDGPVNRLRAAGWPIHFEPEEKWYRAADIETGVRQFAVADPDGYLIRFSQSLGRRPISQRET